MTARNSDVRPLCRLWMTRSGRVVAMGAILSSSAWMGAAAWAQTAPSPPSPPPAATASTPASPDQRADSAIAEDINTKLMASDTLRPLDLGVWVHNGTATLTGTVPTQALRTKAEIMVKSVPGVKNVEDKITIGTQPAVAPGFNGSNTRAPSATPPGNTQAPPPPGGYGQNQSESRYPGNYGIRQPAGSVTIASGTPAYVMVMQPIDSKHTRVGSPFHGILVKDIVEQNGVIAIPRGADVYGTIVDARGPGKLKGRPELALQLTGVNISNASYPFASQIWARGGPGKGGQSAANIAGGAGMGAIVGGAFGGGPAALLGGVLGGLGGVGISSWSHGPQLYIPSESVLTFYLSASVTVHVPTIGEIRQLASRVPPSVSGDRGYRRGYPPSPGYYPPRPAYYPPPPGAPPGGYPY